MHSSKREELDVNEHTKAIKAVHTLVYSDDPPATRAFLRDVLGWPFVEEPDVPGTLRVTHGSPSWRSVPMVARLA